MSYPDCSGYTILVLHISLPLRLSYSSCSILCWQFCPDCLFLAALASGCPVLAELFWLSIFGGSVQLVHFLLYCYGFCSCYPLRCVLLLADLLAVLFWLPNPGVLVSHGISCRNSTGINRNSASEVQHKG